MHSKTSLRDRRLNAIAFVLFCASPLAIADSAETIFDGGFELGEIIQTPGPCDGFYSTDFSLVEGEINPPAGDIPKPDKGVRFTDPGFSTCMVRVTHHDVEPPVEFARNDYSRREPFNADNTRMIVYGAGGWWHIYDANTLNYDRVLNGPAGDAEVQWDPSDPNYLYYMPTNGGMTISKLDVRNDSSQVIADLTGRLPWSNVERLWTKSEGSPSRDNRYWGFMAETGDFNILGYVVYDLQNNAVVGTRSTTIMPDHVSMTPSGRWFTSSGDTDGTWAWSPDFSQKKKLHHKSEHSDIAVGANGHDLYVSIDFQSNNGDVFFVDVDNCPAVAADADPDSTPECPRTVLFQTYLNGAVTSMHISGKAYAKPGWALISTYSTTQDRDGNWPWFTNKEMAIELHDTPRVYGIGYHHGTDLGYWTENQGAVNRDFTRAAFNSNWSVDSDTDVDNYMIGLAPGLIPDARP